MLMGHPVEGLCGRGYDGLAGLLFVMGHSFMWRGYVVGIVMDLSSCGLF